VVELVTNPVRRVLSSAAWFSAISGGRKPFPTNWNVSVEIDAFRYPFTLYCSNSSTPHNGGSCFLGHRTPDLVIYTASLDLAAVQADTTQLLQRIGHPVHRSPSRIITALALAHPSTQRVVGNLPMARYDQRPLFDKTCAQSVRKRFHQARVSCADFTRFHFSTGVQNL